MAINLRRPSNLIVFVTLSLLSSSCSSGSHSSSVQGLYAWNYVVKNGKRQTIPKDVDRLTIRLDSNGTVLMKPSFSRTKTCQWELKDGSVIRFYNIKDLNLIATMNNDPINYREVTARYSSSDKAIVFLPNHMIYPDGIYYVLESQSK
jgi:hypothetical protein